MRIETFTSGNFLPNDNKEPSCYGTTANADCFGSSEKEKITEFKAVEGLLTPFKFGRK